jgi:DNA-directed RNA polymerase subunit RPC12/RpoP
MTDKILKCVDCGTSFTHDEKSQAFFAKMKFTDPKRCKPCRDKRKAETRKREAPEARENDE